MREEAERAVGQVCLQIADAAKRAQPVLGIYQAAAPADRIALLPLLGRIGGGEVRPIVQAALESKDAATYEAGVRAISNWPDAGAADQLLRLAETADLPVHRQWALHALRARRLAARRRRQRRETGEAQAGDAVVEDRGPATLGDRAGGGGAGGRDVAVRRPYMDQSALAEQACRSVVELARHKELRDPNRQEFVAALQKAIATSKDAALLDRAKRLLESQ